MNSFHASTPPTFRNIAKLKLQGNFVKKGLSYFPLIGGGRFGFSELPVPGAGIRDVGMFWPFHSTVPWLCLAYAILGKGRC